MKNNSVKKGIFITFFAIFFLLSGALILSFLYDQFSTVRTDFIADGLNKIGTLFLILFVLPIFIVSLVGLIKSIKIK